MRRNGQRAAQWSIGIALAIGCARVEESVTSSSSAGGTGHDSADATATLGSASADDTSSTSVIETSGSPTSSSETSATDPTTAEGTGTTGTPRACVAEDRDGSCDECVKSSCCDELVACLADEDCECVAECVDDEGTLLPCQNECEVEATPPEWLALVSCMGTSCTTQCP